MWLCHIGNVVDESLRVTKPQLSILEADDWLFEGTEAPPSAGSHVTQHAASGAASCVATRVQTDCTDMLWTTSCVSVHLHLWRAARAQNGPDIVRAAPCRTVCGSRNLARRRRTLVIGRGAAVMAPHDAALCDLRPPPTREITVTNSDSPAPPPHPTPTLAPHHPSSFSPSIRPSLASPLS